MEHSKKTHQLPKKEEQERYFRLHVDHAQDKPKVNTAKKTKKRTVKHIFEDGLRQIIASIVFLIIGFFLLNWSSYSMIIQSRWDQWRGVYEDTPLTDLISDPIVYEQEILEISSDPEVQKRQIPPLGLEIAPIDSRIIIPRINQNIPMVRVSSESLIKRDWAALENEMQEALRNGVVHYPGTSLPGQTGNVVVTGHSSYFPWDPGRFKDVFALLHDVIIGDKIVVYYKQNKYLYEVDNIKIVLPEEINVLKQTPQDKLTLITCTPVGTNLKRLIVTAIPIAKNNQAIINAQSIKVTR